MEKSSGVERHRGVGEQIPGPSLGSTTITQILSCVPCALQGQGQGPCAEGLEMQLPTLGSFPGVGDTEKPLLPSASSCHK